MIKKETGSCPAIRQRAGIFRAMRPAVLLMALFCCLAAQADEGMWVLGNLNKQTKRAMKDLGLQLSPDQLYHPKKASLKDAVVSFGGFCSGVVVSSDGLVFTNHHCGFSSVQQHSSVEHDYLKDGFVARDRSEELSNPGLYVRFLVRSEDVTQRVLKATSRSMSEAEWKATVDSMSQIIVAEVSKKDSTLFGVVDPYYAGNEYRLSVYRDYTDVRLVFAPPSSVGKFGWDTDNWMWPRHTGDFCVFRIYAGKDNLPADYSADNVPYHPEYVAPISLAGYNEGSFCMTLGYPGSTERYLSSFGIEERMYAMNAAMIDVRGVKQAIWKREMDARPDIHIKYASKYDESSNYWKNSIGMNKAIRKLHVLDKKRDAEARLNRWIQQTPAERGELLHLLSSLELAYKQRKEVYRALSYYGEAFVNGPELLQLSFEILNFDFEAEEEQVTARLQKLVEKYENLDLDIDKEVFTAMIGEYRGQGGEYLPPLYAAIDTLYNGNDRAFVDSLYAHSEITSIRGFKRFLERDTTYDILNDPAISLGIDLIVQYYDMTHQINAPGEEIERGERQLNAALRRMQAGHTFYPDANSTMRLSFGNVRGYSPFDGAEYGYHTTVKGIFEKVRSHQGDPDFYVQPEILSLLASDNFGRYADKKGEMNVCFISNNDITGGNSGSAMFNGKGELLGLAFDGNWEAMSSDIIFEPDLQRCIGVDVRYILFMIEKYGGAGNLIAELKIRN